MSTIEEKLKRNERAKEWARKNPEKSKEIAKRSYEKNKESRIKKVAEYKKNNPEKEKVWDAAYKSSAIMGGGK